MSLMLAMALSTATLAYAGTLPASSFASAPPMTAPAGVVLEWPKSAPCEQASYEVRVMLGAAARWPGFAESECHLYPGCGWTAAVLPSPLFVTGDPNWTVYATCGNATGSVTWVEGGGYAEWVVPGVMAPIPSLAGFEAKPTRSDVEAVARELLGRLSGTLDQCGKIGCVSEMAEVAHVVEQLRGSALVAEQIGPAVSWAPHEGGDPKGWSGRIESPGSLVVELAAGQISEGGTGWVLRIRRGAGEWVRAQLDADGPVRFTAWVPGGYVSLIEDGDVTRIVASFGVLQMR